MKGTLLDRLDVVTARANRVRRGTALGAVVAVVAGYLVALSVVDRSVTLPMWLRAVGVAVLLGVAVLAFVRTRRSERPRELALRAAERWPAAGEDVLCALDLRGRELHGEAAPVLVTAALARIEQRAATLDLDALVDRRWLRRGTLAALVALLALAGAWIASPGAMSTAARRGLLLADAAYPTRTRIVSITPGDARLADPARPVTVVARAEGELPEGGVLELRTRSGIELRAELLRGARDEYTATLPHLREDYRYEIALGDARSASFAVAVVPRPEVELALEVTPPAGFAGGAQRFEGADAVRAVEGSSLAVVVRSSKPLKTVRAVEHDALAFEVTDEGARGGPLELWSTLEVELGLVDEDGLAPETPVRFSVRVDPDQRPQVELLGGADVLTLRAAGTLRLLYRASDDGALAALTLHVEPFSGAADDGTRVGQAFAFELPVANDARVEVEGIAAVALADFGAALDSRWQAWIEAEDGRAREPNRASSAPVTLRVVDDQRFEATLAERLAEVARHHVQRARIEQKELALELETLLASETPSGLQQLAERQVAASARVLALSVDGLAPMRAWLDDNALTSGPALARFEAFASTLAAVGARGRDEAAGELERAPHAALVVQRELADELLTLVQHADASIVVTELAQSLENLVRMQQETTRAVGARLRFFAGLAPMVEAAPTDSFDALHRGHARVLRDYSRFVDELGASLRAGGAHEAIARCARTGLEAGVLSRLGGLGTLFELGATAERVESERVALLNAMHQSQRDVLRGMALQLIELAPNSPLAVHVLLELAEERDLRREVGIAGGASAGEAGAAPPAGAAPSDASPSGVAAESDTPTPQGEVVAEAEAGDAELPEPSEVGPELERQKRADLSEETQRKKFEEFDPVHQRDLAKLPGRQTNQVLEKKAVAEELESALNEQAQLERQMASLEQSGSQSARSEIEQQLRQQEQNLRESLDGEQDQDAQDALQNAKDARQAFQEGRDDDARQHQRQALEYTLASYVNELTPQRQERDPQSGSEAPPPSGMPPEDDPSGGAADDETGRTGGGLLVEIRPSDEEGPLAPEPELPPLSDEGIGPGRLWNLDLPPSLRENLRLENPAATPPGYERRLRSYYQSFDRDRHED